MLFNDRKLNKKNDNPFVLKHGAFYDGKLEKYSHLREWIESSFVPRGRIGEVVGRTFDFSKMRIGIFFLVALFFILIARVGWLQIVKGDYYGAMAENNSVRFERLDAQRGIIYDRDLKPLVRNVANFVLYITPVDLPKNEAEAEEIVKKTISFIFPGDNFRQEGLLKSVEEKLSKIKRGSLESFQPVFMADNIEYDRALLLQLEARNLPGISLLAKSRREYLNEGVFSLSHILGYTGKVSDEDFEKYGKEYSLIDYLGKTGIEASWEKDLRGINGRKKIEIDALRREKKILSREEPVDGGNLVLTIDLALQKKTEEILAANLQKAKLARGVVIIENPNNGEILSMVSLPAYDNRLFSQGIKQEDYKKLSEDENKPLFNRAISGEYPSGSIVKSIIAAAALQEKVISEKTTILSNGGLQVGVWFFPDWRALGHGYTDVRKAIADSVNTFFYYVGGGYKDFNGLGIERLVKYLLLFGLGDKVGIDLPNEADGFVPSKEWKEKVRNEKWYIGDTYHLSIGQGDLTVTPLQASSWMSFFASKGKIYQPHLVKSILDKDNKMQKEIVGKLLKEDIIDDYNIEVVRQGLRRTVLSGSAQKLQSLPVEAAAKTGTAQWGTNKDPHAWFTAFAPYKNPEITVTVLVEEGVEGSRIAADIAKEIMMYYFTSK